ncbi:MAG TPA: hypothetical protein VFQ76_14035, partial [Longimicrobiaceae bacterium]|nr:hypothetical protein [Longimicrobiaceae bacterium]
MRVALLLGLQSLVALTTVAFGVMALLVARRLGRSTLPAIAWLVVGVAFTMEGINGIFQSSGAIWAILAGKGSAVYAGYLRLGPVGNHGRSVLKIGLGLALIALPLLKRVPARALPGVVTVWLLLFMLLGSFLGWNEGSLRAGHFSIVALLDSFEMIVIWGALVGALVSGGIDRLLWIGLAINGVRQALNVVWTSALVWRDTPGAWVPSV